MNISPELAAEKLSKWKTKSPPLLFSLDIGDVFAIFFCEIDKVDPPILHVSVREGGAKLTLVIEGATFNSTTRALPLPDGTMADFEDLRITFRRGGECSLLEMPNYKMPEIESFSVH